MGADSAGAVEICETRRTQKEKLQMEMISDLKDEAQDFMQKQESARIFSSRTGAQGVRAQSAENTQRKYTLDAEDNQGILAGLFKEEDEQVKMDKQINKSGNHALNQSTPGTGGKLMHKKSKKVRSPGKKRRGWEAMAPKPPVAFKPIENKPRKDQESITSSAPPKKRKFISKFAQKNLQPVEPNAPLLPESGEIIQP